MWKEARNEKRWQDVMDIAWWRDQRDFGSNIQHIESVNEEVQDISGIEVKERIPDSVLARGRWGGEYWLDGGRIDTQSESWKDI